MDWDLLGKEFGDRCEGLRDEIDKLLDDLKRRIEDAKKDEVLGVLRRLDSRLTAIEAKLEEED